MSTGRTGGKNFLGSREDFYTQLFQAIPFLADLEGDMVNLHSARVAILASELSSDVLESDPNIVFLAGLFHDVGANGSNIHPLRARSLADHSNNPWLKAHSVRASHVLKNIKRLECVSSIVLEHHEWFDGGGFPFGRAGMDIMPEAQALRVADAFDIAMLSFGNMDACFKYLEGFSGKEFDSDLLTIFRRYIEENDFGYLWTQPDKVVDRVLKFYKKWNFTPEEKDVFQIIKLFDLKKKPVRNHTMRVKDIVRTACALAGPISCETIVRSVYVHELYTTYEPYKGAYLGSITRREMLERFPLVLEAFVEMEDDAWVSELINGACMLDMKLAANGAPVTRERVLQVLAEMNGTINPEVIILLKQAYEKKGEFIYSGTAA